MNEIRRVLQQASSRLLLVDLLRTLSVTMAAAVGALIIALFAHRIFGVPIDWPQGWLRLAAILAGVAAVAAIGWSLWRRSRGVALARELDERANLKETLSTAMCVAAWDDPWARVVVDTAREKAVSVNVKQAIPITAPRVWPLPFAMMLALVVLWFSVPTFDVLGLLRQQRAEAERKAEIQQVHSEVKAADEKILEKLRQANVDLKLEEGAEAGENKPPQNPEDIRRAAVKKLTAMTEKLNDMKQGEKAQQMEALKQALKQLKQPGPGPLDQLSKSLAQGNFQKAQEDLNELAKQLANDSMSKEQKEQMQQQLEKLQQQFEKLAQDRSDLEKQLEKAGLNKEQIKQAARDPDALKKALDELKNLSEEQKQQLMQKAMAQNQACRQCDGMSESLGQMCQGMSQNGMSPEGMEGMEGMMGQLSAMEMAAMELDALDAATSEALKQLAKMAGQCKGDGSGGDGEGEGGGCNSPWRAGETAGRFGQGSGGPGQGMGMSPEEIDSPVTIEKKMSQSKNTGGPIIGQRLVYGEQVRGESTAEFVEAVEAANKAASEALDAMTVRRELQPAVKHYFGRLEARAKAQRGEK